MNVPKLSTQPSIGWRGWLAVGLVVWAGVLELTWWDTRQRYKEKFDSLNDAIEREDKPWRYQTEPQNTKDNE